ncbi:uncharacterized protein [Dysidea avara]|uniref:uncharacterized protein n=1 Tax=Dysidea avara TaxID=196820 RepID=UPI003328A460
MSLLKVHKCKVYPVYGHTIKELTIRERVEDSSFHEALTFLLNEWTALGLAPQTLNIVSDDRDAKSFYRGWRKLILSFKISRSQSVNHIGHLNAYKCFNIVLGLVPVPPLFHIQIESLPSLNVSFVNVKNCGLAGLDQGCLLLNQRTTGDGYVLHKASAVPRYRICSIPLKINNMNFLTHFSANNYGLFHSSHLEQLAITCPNLQVLNLRKNVNCLKCLRGLQAISTHCRKLKGLNIFGISVKEVESCVRLWEIIVDLQLTYLAIELCCLLFCGVDNQIIVSLHQKCLKMKSLEFSSSCTKCDENKQPLVLSNFPLLIHCRTDNIDSVHIFEKLKYWYCVNDRIAWSIGNCNLEQLCMIVPKVAFPDSFMSTLSAHGGLIHVIMSVDFITQTGIATFIENSPSLITFHVYIRSDFWCISSNFRSRLKEKYSNRKLFLCGSYHLEKGTIGSSELHIQMVQRNVDFISLWSCD